MQSIYVNTNLIFLDLSSSKTLFILNYFSGIDNSPIVLVGNKIDCSQYWEVKQQEGQRYVSEQCSNGNHLVTSAKYNVFVDNVFKRLLMIMFGETAKKVCMLIRLISSCTPYSIIVKNILDIYLCI